MRATRKEDGPTLPAWEPAAPCSSGRTESWPGEPRSRPARMAKRCWRACCGSLQLRSLRLDLYTSFVGDQTKELPQRHDPLPVLVLKLLVTHCPISVSDLIVQSDRATKRCGEPVIDSTTNRQDVVHRHGVIGRSPSLVSDPMAAEIDALLNR